MGKRSSGREWGAHTPFRNDNARPRPGLVGVGVPLFTGHTVKRAPSSPAVFPIFSCYATLPDNIPKASLLFLHLTPLCRNPCSSAIGFFWPLSCLREPPAATNSPSSWLSVYHTPKTMWIPQSDCSSHHTALGICNWLPIDSGRLGEFASSYLLYCQHMDLGLKEQSWSPPTLLWFQYRSWKLLSSLQPQRLFSGGYSGKTT